MATRPPDAPPLPPPLPAPPPLAAGTLSMPCSAQTSNHWTSKPGHHTDTGRLSSPRQNIQARHASVAHQCVRRGHTVHRQHTTRTSGSTAVQAHTVGGESRNPAHTVCSTAFGVREPATTAKIHVIGNTVTNIHAHVRVTSVNGSDSTSLNLPIHGHSGQVDNEQVLSQSNLGLH